jgi:hypothetical protein
MIYLQNFLKHRNVILIFFNKDIIGARVHQIAVLSYMPI